MALPDLTGQNIENTYPRLVQTDGTSYFDGTGSLLSLGGGAQNLESVLTQGSSTSIAITSSAEYAISGSGIGSFGLVQTTTIKGEGVEVKVGTQSSPSTDNIFLIQIEDTTKFTINNQGIMVLSEPPTTPTAVAGGIYYSSSIFFMGTE
tara:strand:+ start:135 stop:581 length:447 start_codon:yes stop_codon:yes gene_type:complete